MPPTSTARPVPATKRLRLALRIGSQAESVRGTGKFTDSGVPAFLANLAKFEKASRKSKLVVG